MRESAAACGLRQVRRLALAGLLLAGGALPVAGAEPTVEPLLRLETGMHTAVINRIATDRAGRWAVTASDDKTARVWEVASARLLTVLRPPQDAGDEGKLYAVAMSPDGQTVAAAGWSGGDWDEQHSIYLFDRASARLLRRIGSLPNVVNHLAWSPAGRWLAASLGGSNGIRVFDATTGAERGRDADFSDDSYSVHFSSDSRRLVSTGYDRLLRTYAVGDQGSLHLLRTSQLTGGKRPYAARYSPDGRRIAVAFRDSGSVQVFESQNLAEQAGPAAVATDDGGLGTLAWSADGRSLLAGGLSSLGDRRVLRRWRVDDWSRHEDRPMAAGTVMDLVPLPAAAGAGWLFAASDPAWGVLDGTAHVLRRRDPVIADLRAQREELLLSGDGRQVQFAYDRAARETAVFDLSARTLEVDAPVSAAALRLARTSAPGLQLSDWKDNSHPLLNGRRLVLDPNEMARSLAITADDKRFVLGADWTLRMFDRSGRALWTRPVPSVAWAVNISADSRFVVVAYGDGTLRWHRLDDGREILALFPHADRRRWVAWTPEGYFDAAPGAEDMIGYHLNQGREHEGEFVVTARQLWETDPGVITRRLDADGDRLLAEQVQRRGDVRSLLAAGRVPALALESAADGQSSGSYTLAVRIRNPGQGSGRLVVRVDDVELAGRWNTPALTPDSVLEMPVNLAAGQRKLTVELVDARGVASRPVTARIQVTNAAAGAAGATLHVLAVGVSDYRDSDLKLRFAADDARAVAERLQLRGRARFGQRIVARTLVDQQATRANIGKALTEMAARARPDDTFVLYLAGHGTTLDEQYYFLPHELDYANDDAVRQGAVSQSQLRSWLSLLPQRSLLLLDTCRAGNAVQLASRAGADKGAFSTLMRLTNRAVIVASSQNDMALEGYQGHGVFSWVLLDAIDHADYDENGTVDVTDIATHVKRLVPAITERVFKYRQVPMQDTPGEPFVVAVPLPKGR